MELDDLKGIWSKYAQQNNKNQNLPASEFEKMIGKRTTDCTKKIGRNIRIGLGIVLAWAVIGVSIDFIFTPFFDRHLNKPYMNDKLLLGIFGIELFNYVLIFATLILFGIRFNKIEKQPIDRFDLKETLTSSIRIIDAYRKMFYVVLALVLIYSIASFSTGFVLEYNHQLQLSGTRADDVPIIKWLIVAVSFLFVASVIVGVYYLLFTFFFKRLYGRHLKLLKGTLKELTESNRYNTGEQE